MNKLYFLKTMLLLCALIAGSSSVWADTSTLTPTSSKIAPSDDYITVSYANGGGSNPYWATNILRLYAKNTITFESNNGEKITGISFSAKVNANNSGKYPSGITASVGSLTNASFSSTGNYNIGWSYSTGTESVTLTIGGSAGNIEVASYSVTYTVPEKVDPTITFNNGSVRVGKTLDLSTLFSSNSTGNVTYSITEGGTLAAIDGSTLTAGTTAGSVTVKAQQAAKGDYSAGEKTATITVTDPALSSIAITTAPTKTTYDEGELFDATDMVVTATFADASTDVVTASCTWSPNGALDTSDTEVTVSYTYKGVTKTATQAITVNAYTQPTDVTATFNNTFLGVTAGSRISEKTTITQDKIKFIFDKPSGSNWPQGDTDVIRIYQGTTLQIDAPSGYALTSITFTANGDWKNGMTASAGTYSDTKDNDNKTYWTGFASNVTFTPAGTHRIATVKITLGNKESITVTDAGFATYVSDADLDYSGLDVKAYRATVNGTTISFENVTTVPAGAGVLLQGAGTFNVPVAASAVTAWDKDDNAFVRGKGVAVETDNGDCKYNYILNKVGDVVGFYKAAGQTVAKNRAYLQTTTSQARIALNIEDETAGIESAQFFDERNGRAERTVYNSQLFYNLNGQQVAQPTKGLYIVNGKKVIK